MVGDGMADKNALIFGSRPKLRSPYVVCGIDGSLNAGNVSAGGIQYLMRHFKAIKFAEIITSRYHVYNMPGEQGLRPVFKMDDGLIVESHFPKDEFYYALNPTSDHDLVLFLGTEPHLDWEEYADTVVTVACDLGASRLYAFGAILDRSPYAREPRITCTCTSAKVKGEMAKYSVSFSSREGAATIDQVLLYACQKKGLDGVALTARAPY
jgi:proteasome assembly chaperone (PAC2) family protein